MIRIAQKRFENGCEQNVERHGSAVWVYEGALYDPLDGRKIANVEGLELVRQLAETHEIALSKLKARQIQGDYATTVLTRRLFLYQSPQEPRRLLSSIRLRPNAPLRKIPTNQAVASYDTATTYVSRNKGRDLVLHTEWPNGKCLWGTATSPPEQVSSNSMDFTVYAKPSSKDLPDLSTHDNDENVETVVAPKRSQLVQFGASQQAAEQHKFGARETYSYTMENTSQNWFSQRFGKNKDTACRVRYTRYGEGPPWYGPNKYCMLELQGRRVQSVDDAPPLAAGFAAERLPGFLAVHTPIEIDAAAERAVDWFRRGNLAMLDNDEEQEQVPQGRLRGLAYPTKQKGGAVLQRIRAASTLAPADF